MPLSRGHGVPGPLVGYMPQDHTLHGFFSTRELLVFYGRVYGVADLQGRVTELLQLLDMDDDKLQKRQGRSEFTQIDCARPCRINGKLIKRPNMKLDCSTIFVRCKLP